MKAKLPFKTTFRFAMLGSFLTRALTIFLCAFSFALVTLASTGFLYDQVDFLTRALLNYMANTPSSLNFCYYDLKAQDWCIPSKWMEHIREETGLDFVYHYDYSINEGLWRFLSADYWIIPFCEPVSGTPQAYRDCGVKLVAGKFPEEMDEVAITLEQFEALQTCGYAYNIQNYVYNEDGYWGEGWYYVEAGSAEIQRIDTYNDAIGKEFVVTGDPETGSRGIESLYTLRISGIVDVSEAELWDRESYVVLHSAAWQETFWPTMKDNVRHMWQAPTDDYDLARTCVELSLEMVDEFLEIYPDHDEYDVNLGVYPITDFVDITTITSYKFWGHKNSIIFIGAVAGAFFGIFAALLCWHLMTSMLSVQRIKIGILRSLGAGEKDVVKIVLLFAFILSVFTFLLAIGFTLAGYYGFLYPAFYTPKYGVSEFVLNGWNFLVLAVLSFGVPLLCSVVPLRKFLKKSIVENISGNIKAR